MPIYDFGTTYALKQDTNDDTSGTKKTNTRGRAAEEPTFKIKYLAAAGVNPRTEFTNWRYAVGKEDYLYIGGTQYGKNKFELKEAAVSEVLFDNKGRTIQAVVTLKFFEKLPVTKKSTSKTSASSKTTSSSKGTKAQAKAVGASKTDKQLKNPYGTNKKK